MLPTLDTFEIETLFEPLQRGATVNGISDNGVFYPEGRTKTASTASGAGRNPGKHLLYWEPPHSSAVILQFAFEH
jgi:hypothetical protein